MYDITSCMRCKQGNFRSYFRQIPNFMFKSFAGTSDEITVKNGDTLYLQYYVVPDFD